jgi:hypothetical protein
MATKNPYNDFYGDDAYNAAGQEYYQRVVKPREEEEAVRRMSFSKRLTATTLRLKSKYSRSFKITLTAATPTPNRF